MNSIKNPMTADAFSSKRVKFVTLGCKVNQYETQGMREDLAAGGILEAPSDSCDFVVINTCTVTADADRENRYWIRRMKREHPEAVLVVTGCYVEKNRRDIEALPDVDLILSNDEKAGITERLLTGCASPESQDTEAVRARKREFAPLKISSFPGNGRAFIKIQDGCNHSCSFCKVVLVRGRSRSRPLEDIVEEAKRLCGSGFKEVVLTGIQLGAYGLEWEDPHALSRVIEQCARIEGLDRIRLSSIEPTDVKPELIRTLRDVAKCCPHLHIPLQSGDDDVLLGMTRRYASGFYEDLIARLRGELSDFSLSLDVMAGFPGETPERFKNTMDLLRKVRPLKCHVFPYSKREGTRAARLPEENDTIIVRERVRELIRLGDELGRLERLAYVRRMMPVLVEKKLARGGLIQGLTANYLKVCFQGDEDLVGQVVPVELLSLEGDVFLGVPRASGK